MVIVERKRIQDRSAELPKRAIRVNLDMAVAALYYNPLSFSLAILALASLLSLSAMLM